MPLSLWLAIVSGPDYAGAETCRHCHPAQSGLQSSSSHARALAPAKHSKPGDWAFGAGVQAITFVRRLDAESYLEEGESWYRALGGYARTPGDENSVGVRDRIFDPSAAILPCFACDSTGPVRVSRDHRILPCELGVPCTEAADTPDPRDPWNARYQPLLLAASACFRQSKGCLNCLTCHAPHAPIERKLAAYDASCGRCHANPRHKVVIAGRACAECHMPAVPAQPYLTFANHRIANYAPADPMSPLRGRR